MFICALLISYFSFIPTEINISDNRIPISEAFKPIINLVLSANILNLVIRFIDSLIIDRLINEIGNNISIYSLNLFLLDKGAFNLWVEPLTPKFFGDISGASHKLPLFILNIIYLILFSLIMSIVFILNIKISFDYICSASSFAEYFLPVLSLLVTLQAIVIISSFLFKYSFREAEFDEGNLEPTEHFKEKMRKELSEGDD